MIETSDFESCNVCPETLSCIWILGSLFSYVPSLDAGFTDINLKNTAQSTWFGVSINTVEFLTSSEALLLDTAKQFQINLRLHLSLLGISLIKK